MYESMHDQELASLMTEKQSIGLADIVYKDLVRLEEKINKQRSEDNKAVQDSNSAVGFFG